MIHDGRDHQPLMPNSWDDDYTCYNKCSCPALLDLSHAERSLRSETFNLSLKLKVCLSVPPFDVFILHNAVHENDANKSETRTTTICAKRNRIDHVLDRIVDPVLNGVFT